MSGAGPVVIKVGGSTLDDPGATFADIAAMAQSGDIPVVVHGGGPEATRWLEAMGIESRFERGLRVTDERALPIIVAVYAGLVNKRIVAALQGAGAAAIGISGADGRLVTCELQDPALGFVGRPLRVNPAPLEALRAAGFVPVVGPVSVVPGEGADQLVNVNADTVATEIAAAIEALELVFLTDVPGVKGREGDILASLNEAETYGLIENGTIAGGMIPKVEACLYALGRGVKSRILDGRTPGALLDGYAGTRFA